ncbi:hypothetical protein HHI36_013611 [Cryptolaemus montrouzieri]|uniref:Uncharacterized protein n=1 Tax=Cryptolaemus montrouzieri TaxID=559131 RepID=A0ABD2NJ08_9CUCU
MSKRDASHQQKMSRNDRFAQMSHQEKIIEQKKKEILAKLEAKKNDAEITESSIQNDPKTSCQEDKNTLNVFSNDGSFLSTFKSMREKKTDTKMKFKSKDHSDDRGNKFSKWGQKQATSPKDRSKLRISRFSDKTNFEQQKITINTSFNNPTNQQNFDYSSISHEVQEISVPTQTVTNQPLLKNEVIDSAESNYSNSHLSQTIPQNELQVLVSQPVLISMPPSQLPPHNLTVSSTDSINLQPVTIDNLAIVSNQIPVGSQNNLSTVACIPTVELASIPPPNPIQVQNIPQPDPLNALNIPQPAPLQVQNIPTPATLQLNEIPNPQPLDLMAIPTPGEKKLSDAEFLKNIPPPNKSVPPPNIGESSMNIAPPHHRTVCRLSICNYQI